MGDIMQSKIDKLTRQAALKKWSSIQNPKKKNFIFLCSISALKQMEPQRSEILKTKPLELLFFCFKGNNIIKKSEWDVAESGSPARGQYCPEEWSSKQQHKLHQRVFPPWRLPGPRPKPSEQMLRLQQKQCRFFHLCLWLLWKILSSGVSKEVADRAIAQF